jgi:hypothetical protein
LKEDPSANSTLKVSPLNLIGYPTDFSEAKNLIFLIGKSLSSSTSSIFRPTLPVAPQTATLYYPPNYLSMYYSSTSLLLLPLIFNS